MNDKLERLSDEPLTDERLEEIRRVTENISGYEVWSDNERHIGLIEEMHALVTEVIEARRRQRDYIKVAKQAWADLIGLDNS